MNENSRSNVGVKVRGFRERLGWSLRTLAERSGLSINAISRIERGENSPTITSLNKLAGALRVPINDFFFEKDEQAVLFVKRGSGHRASNNGVVAEHLGIGLSGQQFEPILLTVEPRHSNGSASFSHVGNEFVHCLSGEVEYYVGNQVYRLEPGDSLLFEAAQPHYWRNQGDTQAVMLVVYQSGKENGQSNQRYHLG